MEHTTLWLIRHGETDWNTERRFQGQTDIPLNCTGREQAGLLATRLGAEQTRTRFAAIYSSDLSRAMVTAAPIGRQLGLDIMPEPALRERHYGVLSALTPEEMAIRHPEAHARWLVRDPDYAMENGESLRSFSDRVLTSLAIIAARHPAKQVIVVAHGGVLDCVYRAATGMDLSAKRQHALLNASVNRVRCLNGQFRVEAWGDVAHLEAEALNEV
ncbi:MAG: histidine phosphatase family protein [Burkholderiales bacterium]|nr:histidine phosphatase family protein [Burkholderiales bacterium]